MVVQPAETKVGNLFARVIVGVDGSTAGLDALRQVESLAAPSGTVRVVSVEDYAPAMKAGAISPEIAKEIRSAADAAVDGARDVAPTAEAIVIEGDPATALIEAADRGDDTLVAVGGHGRSRMVGIVTGSVMTNIVHRAHVSVYVARPVGKGGDFPRSVIVGVDGSENSLLAYTAASELAERLGIPLRAIAASAGEVLDEEGLKLVPELERIPESPVAALEDRAAAGDVLVVGSRGLHGVAALGSVSERLAHSAAASVLIVRSS